MKTIEQASEWYAGINDDKSSNSAKVYDKYDLAIAFISGTGFAERWISVEEELPEMYSNVLVKTKTWEIHIASLQAGDIFIHELTVNNWQTVITDITHWRKINIE